MLGNDVVDLRDPDSDARTHPHRFDERVFSPAEQRLIRRRPEASQLRWRLWAAKEAAFKAARRRDGTTVFSPPRFEVELSTEDEGRVTHRREGHAPQHFDLRWWHADGAVHAVASAEGVLTSADPTALIHGLRRLRPDQVGDAVTTGGEWGASLAVRELAREQLGAVFDVPSDALEIRKQGRVPVLWLDDRPVAADLSLSHHGEWIAFAYLASRSTRGRGATLGPRFRSQPRTPSPRSTSSSSLPSPRSARSTSSLCSPR